MRLELVKTGRASMGDRRAAVAAVVVMVAAVSSAVDRTNVRAAFRQGGTQITDPATLLAVRMLGGIFYTVGLSTTPLKCATLDYG